MKPAAKLKSLPGQPTNSRPTETNPARETTTRQFGWVLLPLRLFLGITFIYAGIQKLTDPQYFNPAARGYIGKQIIAFAHGSPIHEFLIRVVVPHAHLFGALVAYGELAIGIGTLLGLLLRPATFFGALLNMVFFLSASWRIYPYFYGSDIVFVFCWITLLLAGPLGSGLPALDSLLAQRLLLSVPSARKMQLARALHFFLGVGEGERDIQSKQVVAASKRPGQQVRYSAAKRPQATRRSFLWGLAAGGAGALGIVWLANILHFNQSATGTPDQGGSTTGTASTPGGGEEGGGNGTPNPTSTPSGSTGGTVIAHVSDVSVNSAVSFTIASNGDPGVLVHLSNNQFVAYDATCTHAGCPVDYDPSSKLLLCPCHGAAFDPAQGASVVQGPADTPLANVAIHVDSATGTITLA